MVSVWKFFFRKRTRSAIQPADLSERDRLPKHIAIIMDGNGRWARARGLPRAAGHHAGMGSMREIIRAADDLGIQVLTLYAFSTENWSRPQREVQYLWQLVGEFFRSDMDELAERNVRITFIGDTTQLPMVTQSFVQESMKRTHSNTGMVVQFALNYGARAEIISAVRKIAAEVQSGQLQPDKITEGVLSATLETTGLPDPDLLIRTAGDQRVSNFLLWQIAYTELYFSQLAWPDFSRQHFYDAIRVFMQRERRFGGLK